MTKLEGVIYKMFDQYVVLRGFAKISELANVSYRPAAYQRDANDEHKIEIVKFLAERKYRYFPEITLACRATEYMEFLRSIGVDSAVNAEDSKHVPGLRVLKERVPYDSDRARHAFLQIENKTLTRVDGNHRLEPFDEPDVWWEMLEGIDKAEIDNLIVPYTVVFSEAGNEGDRFESGIFHNINFKQLPLRQEASLKIIAEMWGVADYLQLGIEYPLAIQLIKYAKDNHFAGMPFLTPIGDDASDVYRTACLRISKLLNDKLNLAKIILNTCVDKIDRYENLIEKHSKRLDSEFSEKTEYEIKLESDSVDLNERLDDKSKEKLELKTKIERAKQKIEVKKNIMHEMDHFIDSVGDISKIVSAIQSLRPIYDSYVKKKGNLALLSALVYYKLLEQKKFETFVIWSQRNQINHIDKIDDLPIHNSDSLIEMFERIFEAKKRKVFISMQFGDDQSEMIYEKIVQTIDKYNKEIGVGLEILVQPIRIDRTIAPHAFTISEEIMNAIQDCSLIIADLSSGNKNVYHEIGYAMGIAEAKSITPPVILLYKENTSHKSKETDPDSFIGFNLRGFSQLRFKTYDELSRGLKERLKLHFEV